jgi:hypothetical protein
MSLPAPAPGAFIATYRACMHEEDASACDRPHLHVLPEYVLFQIAVIMSVVSWPTFRLRLVALALLIRVPIRVPRAGIARALVLLLVFHCFQESRGGAGQSVATTKPPKGTIRVCLG